MDARQPVALVSGSNRGREELERALAFITRVDEDAAGELMALEFGTGIFDPERPLVWDSNYVRIERVADLEAAALAELVEPLFAQRGLAHRQLVVPETPKRGLQSGFEALGWRAVHELVMVSRRPPEPQPHPVEEASFEELRGPVREVELMEPPGVADPAVVPALVDQLAGRDERVAAATAEHRFVVRADGMPVAWCRLYAGDGIGQVEQVTTHPHHRNRGYARAVVSAAVAASRDRGDELTFLVALADDWPQQLYRRLGFEPVGVSTRFRRTPQRQRDSSVPS
jgi:ribosomal protein S18 acetylase RimI-like enzyme